MSSTAQHELGSDVHQLPGQRQTQASGHIRAAGPRLCGRTAGSMGGRPNRRACKTSADTFRAWARRSHDQSLTCCRVSFRSGWSGLLTTPGRWCWACCWRSSGVWPTYAAITWSSCSIRTSGLSLHWWASVFIMQTWDYNIPVPSIDALVKVFRSHFSVGTNSQWLLPP